MPGKGDKKVYKDFWKGIFILHHCAKETTTQDLKSRTHRAWKTGSWQIRLWDSGVFYFLLVFCIFQIFHSRKYFNIYLWHFFCHKRSTCGTTKTSSCLDKQLEFSPSSIQTEPVVPEGLWAWPTLPLKQGTSLGAAPREEEAPETTQAWPMSPLAPREDLREQVRGLCWPSSSMQAQDCGPWSLQGQTDKPLPYINLLPGFSVKHPKLNLNQDTILVQSWLRRHPHHHTERKTKAQKWSPLYPPGKQFICLTE